MSVSVWRLALLALGSGVAGWVLENALFPEDGGRYSKSLGKIPLLPVYAAGGAAVALAAPSLRSLPLPARAAVYGAGLSVLELAACRMDRALPGGSSWGYGTRNACVDLPHAFLWAAMGLGVEAIARKVEVTT